MTRRKDSGLDTLKSLRTRILAQAPEKAPTSKLPSAPEAQKEADDPELFRREMRGIAPIDDGGRAEINKPRPAPVPRPRTTDPEPEAPSHTPDRTQALGAHELFQASMQDVVPLANGNRVELSGARALAARSERRRLIDPLAKPDVENVPPLLPTNPEHMDAAELFRHAVRGAAPVSDRNRIEAERPPPPPLPIKRTEDEASALRETMEAPISLEDRLEMGDEAVFLRPGMPRRALLDLRRGRWTLQGELDLHGLTREDARLALSHFLAASLQRGARCVRVIHGKGLGSPGGVSILKQLSRGWLAQREEILAFCQAGPTQGGSGALLVLLRGNAPTRSKP